MKPKTPFFPWCFPLGFSAAQRRLSSSRAFSLVEVTIALGIIAISMLTMLGLVPVGLSGMRSAMTETVRAQIVQNVTSQALLVGFSNLAKVVTNDKYYYFEDQGRQQNTLPQKEAPNTSSRYRVSVTQSSAPTPYPGSGNAPSTLATSVTTLNITIKLLNSTVKDETYVVLVPNQGN